MKMASKRPLIILVTCLSVAFVMAAAQCAHACPTLAYQELKEMQPKELQRLRCEYNSEFYSVNMDQIKKKYGTDGLWRMRAGLSLMQTCDREIKRIERIMNDRGLTRADCT